jgi:hypothetical protein
MLNRKRALEGSIWIVKAGRKMSKSRRGSEDAEEDAVDVRGTEEEDARGDAEKVEAEDGVRDDEVG